MLWQLCATGLRPRKQIPMDRESTFPSKSDSPRLIVFGSHLAMDARRHILESYSTGELARRPNRAIAAKMIALPDLTESLCHMKRSLTNSLKSWPITMVDRTGQNSMASPQTRSGRNTKSMTISLESSRRRTRRDDGDVAIPQDILESRARCQEESEQSLPRRGNIIWVPSNRVGFLTVTTVK